MVDVSRFDVVTTKSGKTEAVGVVISPDELNGSLNTVVVAPMASNATNAPSRVSVTFKGKSGHIVLDKITTLEKSKINNTLGKVSAIAQERVCETLTELFAA